MSFLDQVFERQAKCSGQALLTELCDPTPVVVTGRDLLDMIRQARAFLRSRGLRAGDRCVLLAPNGVHWIAMDLAIIAEGLIAVPLYFRQAPSELVAMMKDCSPSLICCGDAALRGAVAKEWPEAAPQVLFDDIFSERNRSKGDESSWAGASA